MTPQHVISQLLQSDTKYSSNLKLLKKIILSAYFGRLRINGQPPDISVSVGNYLFDNERIMFDFTRLSDKNRDEFIKWIFQSHSNEMETSYFNGAYVSEYRGFTAEVNLSWWGRLMNWFKRRYSHKWKITDMGLSLNYQLIGIEMCHGKDGILVGFDQFLVPPSGGKYHDPEIPQEESLGNTKRVFITDILVEQLAAINLDKYKVFTLLRKHHPHAIHITNPVKRYEEMHEYREMQRFVEGTPWYIRFWNWIKSFFVEEVKTPKVYPSDNHLDLIADDETLDIFVRRKTKEIIVREKRPDIENLVLCGGGPKIFAHIGVWKALNDANIRPIRFAGSSAGAIMSLMCYLGYSAEEVHVLFKNFKQETIVQYDIDFNGFSDSHSLKTALDFAIIKRVKEVTTKYNIPYPQGKITFRTLDLIRQQCPDCGFGEELIVTSTKKKARETTYFSLKSSPTTEVSEAVRASALFPVIFRHHLIDGEEHNDGGILSNFPTEVFRDDHSSFLESEYGNNLKVLAVQFDNGTERTAVDKIMERVYKEGPVINWIYGLLTGVNDPASGWEKDRLKLRKYASQTIIPNIDGIELSGFSVKENDQKKLIECGVIATEEYLKVRYGSKDDTQHRLQERMYTSFQSFGELLSYCCYRGDLARFELVHNLIRESAVPDRAALIRQSTELRREYFKSSQENNTHHNTSTKTFFGHSTTPPKDLPPTREIPEVLTNHYDEHDILLAIYPIFLELGVRYSSNKDLSDARHALSATSPLKCLDYLAGISEKAHSVIHILIYLLKELKANPRQEVFDTLKQLEQFLQSKPSLEHQSLYGKCDLTLPQCNRLLTLMNKQNFQEAGKLLGQLKNKEECLQDIKDEVYCDELGLDSSMKA